MIFLIILGLLSMSGAQEELEESQSRCNCSRVLHAEETTTEVSPTFPTTSFTCWNRYDGYYADIEVDCTIFHYCQTWQYPTGLNETVKWDFACPQSTIFNQKILSCTPPNISFDCQESPNYYWVNYNFTFSTTSPPVTEEDSSTSTPNFGQQLIVGGLEPHSQQVSPEPTQNYEFSESVQEPDKEFATEPSISVPVVEVVSTPHPNLEQQPESESHPSTVSSEAVSQSDSGSGHEPTNEFETDPIHFP